ncbi:MAG: 1-deoxy-D-xylulose-5-phosphate reductoisomerase [Microthrixaceae bacterium]|nr:1-deoxy-D-xylulose-5-phosphate reductoisomerase [Microthrixaceae bacterium]MCB1010569.1 1-deoxy-D-xylulose-5-phosphate reductoisomerase [Microthrixaceae bacterium]MCB9386405.1 1-deoxy-D-xylulose-5-phosphate reductoisomerase [Microthrixaceae bacterium]MCO5320872.1 1-deoxy-D-xylulose-5-phosphate reductoisomerase [Microthrixaceae bacterium]
MTTVAVLGSTGSIGTQTLDVVAAEPDRFEIVALGANSSVQDLARQARQVHPEVVAIADSDRAAELRELLPKGVELLAGPDAMAEAAIGAEVAVNGVVGFAGLPVTLAVLGAGRRLALANKESLIAAGPVVAPLRDTPGAELVPVDSEHCAIHMCLRAGEGTRRLRKVVLTASGGPFRGRSRSELESVTVQEALEHPTWSMGPKITVDSSTLMNKGLEVIEAHELFGADYDDIDVVVHPQSIVHSMASFTDGATIAQLSLPDMRLPIAYALAYPDRVGTPFGAMDFDEAFSLDFEPPDRDAFRCLDLAFAAGRAGGTAPALLSAANESVVEAFLDGRVRWVDIPAVLCDVLDRWDGSDALSVESVLDADATGRAIAKELMSQGTPI